jgi:hypothetical protein
MRAILMLACALGSAQERDPAEVIKLATQKAVASIRGIPNYTCVQTVTRNYYRPVAATIPRACPLLMQQRLIPTPDLRLQHISTDRLRLEVTLASRGEIFSWVGGSSFEEGIDRVVRSGPIGTGAFGGYLSTLFGTDVKKFEYERKFVTGGRTLMVYSFRVPKAGSHYRVKMLGGGGWTVTGYSGEIEVDAGTAEVAGLVLRTDELPPATGNCHTVSMVDFAMTVLGKGRYLLPTVARQRFISPTGEETENTSGLSGCREYRGESTVRYFEAPSPSSGTTPQSTLSDGLPPYLRFRMELLIPIDTGTAAAGDPFTGRLATPLEDFRARGLGVLARKGTLVKGRIMRVENFYLPCAESIVVLKPEWLEIRGVKVPVMAVRDYTEEASRRRGKRIEVVMPLRGEVASGAFRLPGERVVVRKGFVSYWKTVLPNQISVTVE